MDVINMSFGGFFGFIVLKLVVDRVVVSGIVVVVVVGNEGIFGSLSIIGYFVKYFFIIVVGVVNSSN